MNTISVMLLGSIAHATGFAIVGTLVYLALRRFSPAAGALASCSSIVIMALVSLIVLGPWPRWWVVDPAESARAMAALRSDVERVHQALPLQSEDRSSLRPIDSKERSPAAPSLGELPAATESFFARFVGELIRELRSTAARPVRTQWGWPEWLAVAFLASLCLGLARLGLGIMTIQRLRARSWPIADGDLDQEIQVLRAELSCTRKVEARETTELATPATIGWRRPLLLLPGDWREWNGAERRAALAHELAHVCRGDFPAVLLAQLSLALHFYHPLAHWLAARLRLEQELAADAWGAALSGGKTAYLATLAQMALRRDSHSLTWPARAFLPSRGTFVRRIEMLRNARLIPHLSLPITARLLTIGILAALGLLVAGLRGPAGSSMAQTQPQTPIISPRPGDGSYNMAFLPAEAKMVVAIRPQSLLQRREFRTLLESLKQSPALKGALVAPPEEVEQLLAFWEELPQAPAKRGRAPLVPVPSGVILRMSKPQEWKLVLNQRLRSTREVRHDGQSYLSAAGPDAQRWGAFVPDDRTLIFAREDLLRELIEDRSAPVGRHSWDEAWNKVVNGQVMMALETRWIRRRIAQGLQGGPGASGHAPATDLTLETISPLLDKARSYALGFDASEGLTADLVAVAGSEDDTKPVANTLQALLTLGKNGVQGMRQDLRGQTAVSSEAMDWILEAANSLLDKARLDTSGRYVHLQAKSSLDLAAGVKLVAPTLAAANTAARRAISVNHLKQIALAFHNYHSATNRFPAPVLYGGSNKSIPYSWRVAILPYIEQNELYNQYNFEEPWDGPSNRKLLDKMPAVYSYPGADGEPSSPTNPSYFVFSGDGTALSPKAAAADGGGVHAGRMGAAGTEKPAATGGAGSDHPAIADIWDGTSNTILIVEANRDIPWTKPEDIPFIGFDANGPLPDLGGFTPRGFNAAFADGSVHFLLQSINPKVLKALITRAGGEVISADSF